MKNIKGTKLDTLEGTTEKLGDLLYHEGPLLSLFVNSDDSNSYYLYKWTDCDETVNRWLVVQLSSNELKKFFDKKKSLRAIFQTNPKLYLVDIDNQVAVKRVQSCPATALPEAYLPRKDSMFVEETFTEFADEFRLFLTDTGKKKVVKLV
ncbi:hypothetical protein [Persicitalea sp.]|uniref:hypothetical protein n=1 Tax=Persicitalea sp. TaxID=3100273 RepID=UPI0035931808